MIKKRDFIKIFIESAKKDGVQDSISQNKLSKNLTELSKRVDKIDFKSSTCFTVLTKPIICEGLNFGQFEMTFDRKDPTNIWVEGGNLRFKYHGGIHMNIYRKNGEGRPRRVCLSSKLDAAIIHFWSINDLSGVVSVVLTMFAENKLKDGLGQHSWFHENLKKCKICDDFTQLDDSEECKACKSALQIDVV